MTNTEVKTNTTINTYNISEIKNANFIDKSNPKKIFNKVLTKELILLLKKEQGSKLFPNNLSSEDNFPKKHLYIQAAQSHIEESFVWVIGWELRRLFSIGNEKIKAEEKVDDYINHCFSAYRNALQLINYLFISRLWDEKRDNPNIDTNKKLLKDFFSLKERTLRLSELRILFQVLIEIFRSNQLEYPIEEADLGDINEFMDSDSKFNQACSDLERLQEMGKGEEAYSLEHCDTAEISLTKILQGLKFFINYQLVTIKKIEYEESRNSTAQYVKDMSILKKKEAQNFRRRLKYDNVPAPTYCVFFRNSKKVVNLFPFLLDFNALTNANGFQLCFYQRWDGKSKLHYFSTESEKEKIISYRDEAANSVQEIEDEDKKNRLQKKRRLNLVVKEFEEAMNTILDDNICIKPEGSDVDIDDFDNL